jgi:multidrug efflux pump subunit AcrA (membrane-fusion protein)
MTNNRRARFFSSVKQSFLLCPLALAALLSSSACQSSGSSNSEARGVIIVNAPATGEVRRILVREGMTIDEGAPIIEIAVQGETQAPVPTPGESAETRAVRSFKAADAEIEAARAEAVRHEAEVQRLSPLVASGDASQAQLEGERALYERAQQRLQQAQDSKRRAESGLLAARQPDQNQAGNPTTTTTTAPAPREQIVIASATSAGTVSAIAARVGEKVKSGQPLATIRAGSQ